MGEVHAKVTLEGKAGEDRIRVRFTGRDLKTDAGGEGFGRCSLCNESHRRDRMSTHLRACLKRRARADASANALHIYAQSIGSCVYWLHLLARPDATLEDLDRLLRKTWLEPCCGHLSQFHVGPLHYMDRRYAWEEIPDDSVVPMKGVALGTLLHPKAEMEHEYDFGTSTYTQLRVVGRSPMLPGKAKIRVLAKNGMPQFTCTECAGQASLVCAGCFMEGEATLCAKCAKNHECEYDAEALVNIVNSPRMGVCGYTGPEEPRRGTWVYAPEGATATRPAMRQPR